jgi:serine/threonine-protein kinase HipA
MMISNSKHTIGAQEAYVWIWLPGEIEPIVAGRLYESGESPQRYFFTYGRSYLANPDAIPLSPFELPLQRGTQEPRGMNIIPACLRDSAPDAWGRRVLENQYGETGLAEIDYFLLSRSDRIGALDFQSSSSEYVAREFEPAQMEQLLEAAEMVEKRQPLPEELKRALFRGTSVGGARPKALVEQDEKELIAKFSMSSDTYDIVKAEFVAMKLAEKCGLNVAPVSLQGSMNKDVLLVERFDRVMSGNNQARRHMLSALSLLLLDPMEARYASYLEFADLIRQRFVEPQASLRELFARLCFNILIGNTDDHARNHAAFWDGKNLSLAPAFDICPQSRAGGEVSQAMAIGGHRGNLSTLDNARSVSQHFMLSRDEASDLIDRQVKIVKTEWTSVCNTAELAQGERDRLWESAVLNPFCLEDWS